MRRATTGGFGLEARTTPPSRRSTSQLRLHEKALPAVQVMNQIMIKKGKGRDLVSQAANGGGWRF